MTNGYIKKYWKNGTIISGTIILLIFSLPISTAASSILSALTILFWLCEGNFKRKFTELSANKVAMVVIVFVALHILGLLWTDNLSWGMIIIKKQWKLILLAVILTSVKKEHYKYYLLAFICSMAISAITSYLVWLGVVVIEGARQIEPTPFIDRISYNLFLGFAIYLLGHVLLFKKNTTAIKFIGCIILLLMVGSMFITTGRAGQIGFFVLSALLVYQYFENKKATAILIIALLLPGIFLTAYFFSDNFQARINASFQNARNYNINHSGQDVTPIDERLTFLVNSLEIIKAHPLLGVGTGDFPNEYKKINDNKSPLMRPTDNPHNQYVSTQAQLGLTGSIVLLMVFLSQFITAARLHGSLRHLRYSIPLLFMTVSLFESYLQGHEGALLFSISSAILYKNLET